MLITVLSSSVLSVLALALFYLGVTYTTRLEELGENYILVTMSLCFFCFFLAALFNQATLILVILNN